MERRARNEPLSRGDFDATLAGWARARPIEATIGPVGDYGGRAWLHVRDLGRPFHLNVDTRREGVLEYLGMLEADPSLEWRVVPNARGKPNKVAFGPSLRTIPGFYLYLSPGGGGPPRRSAQDAEEGGSTGRRGGPDRDALRRLARLAAQLPPGAVDQGDAEQLLRAVDAADAEVRFDWVSWQGEAERHVREPARVDSADLRTLLRLLTTHVRKERFCEGHVRAMLELGHLQQVLRRIGALLDAQRDEAR